MRRLPSQAARGFALATLTITGAQLHIDPLPTDAPALVQVTGESLVPIDIDRAGRSQITVPILLLPGAIDPLLIRVDGDSQPVTIAEGAIPRITLDSRRYAGAANWRPETITPERRHDVLLLAIAFAATLLLARLLPKRAWIAVTTAGAAWIAVLTVRIANRPTSFSRDNADVRQVKTLIPRTLDIPIRDGEPWVPIVASQAHLRLLDPHIIVDTHGSTLKLQMNAGATLFVKFNPPTSQGAN